MWDRGEAFFFHKCMQAVVAFVKSNFLNLLFAICFLKNITFLFSRRPKCMARCKISLVMAANLDTLGTNGNFRNFSVRNKSLS